MDIAIYTLATMSIVGFAIAGMFDYAGGHRYWAIWTAFISIVLLETSAACWFHRKLAKEDAKNLTTTNAGASVESPSPVAPVIPAQVDELQNPIGAIQPPASGRKMSLGCLFLGTTAFGANAFPLTVIRQGAEDQLVLDNGPDGLLLSAKIFTADGTILCEIVRNQFVINRGAAFKIERSPSGLKVVNNQGVEAIAVSYLERQFMRLSGDFYLRNGLRVRIGKDTLQIGDFMPLPGKAHMFMVPFVAAIWIDRPDDAVGRSVISSRPGGSLRMDYHRFDFQQL